MNKTAPILLILILADAAVLRAGTQTKFSLLWVYEFQVLPLITALMSAVLPPSLTAFTFAPFWIRIWTNSSSPTNG